SQVASSPPSQAQGFGNPAAAFNFSVSGTLLVAGLVALPQEDASTPSVSAVGPGQEWLGFWTRRFEALLKENPRTGPSSDPGSPGASSQRPDVAQASSGPERGATPDGTKDQQPLESTPVQATEL